MSDRQSGIRSAKNLRLLRKLHRVTAVTLCGFFVVMAVTGILLGMKKHCSLLQSETKTGISSDAKGFLPIDSLNHLAKIYLAEYVSPDLPDKTARIEIRPEKGVVKYIFAGHFTGLQIDATNGRLLATETRTSDFVEMLHDGSIIDRVTGFGSGMFKLIYTAVMGVSLLLFVITGLLIRQRKRKGNP